MVITNKHLRKNYCEHCGKEVIVFCWGVRTGVLKDVASDLSQKERIRHVLHTGMAGPR